jgi:hypothetical protein
MLSLLLFRLTSLRVCAGAAPLLYVLWATIFEYVVADDENIHWDPSRLTMRTAAVWRRLSEASLPQ